MQTTLFLLVLGFTLGTARAASLSQLNSGQEPAGQGHTAVLLQAPQPVQPVQPASYSQACGWQLADNPCKNSALQALNFPHPQDTSKFIQCGVYNRPFVIQCPPGEVYDQATTTCVQPQLIVNQPVYNVASLGLSNPCTSQNLLLGNLYYPVARDASQFIQCDQTGQAVVLTCPAHMVWESSKQCCVYATQAGVVVGNNNVIGTAAGTPGILSARNPCTFQAIATNSLYFAHPDPTKFIQCDLQGNAFVQQCPSGLVWNESLLTCASPLAAMAAVAQQQTGVLYPGPLLAGSTLHNATGYIW